MQSHLDTDDKPDVSFPTQRLPCANTGSRLSRWLYKSTERLHSAPANAEFETSSRVERFTLFTTRRLGVQLCRLVSQEQDPSWYDLPWRTVAVRLTGRYGVCAYSDRASANWQSRRRITWHAAEALRRIADVQPESWMLVIHGRRRNELSGSFSHEVGGQASVFPTHRVPDEPDPEASPNVRVV